MSHEPPKLLEWDTQFFGVRIASLSGANLGEPAMAHAIDWCNDQRVDCLYLRTDSDDVITQRAAGETGFCFVDVRMTLDAEIDRLSTLVSHPEVRTARTDDVALLREIAAYNHTNTRFYADGRFDRARCDELYATWIEKSVRGSAERVLVLDAGAGAQGYLTIHLKSSALAEIGLVGLAREAQGRGLGKKLVESALAWMHFKSRGRASVVTQGRNIAAQRLYQACGFRTQSLELWHHRWFDRI